MSVQELNLRKIIARAYPTWDLEMADRFIAWLDEKGYVIVPKQKSEADLNEPSNLNSALGEPSKIER